MKSKVAGCKHYESKVMTAHAKSGGPIEDTSKPAARFFMRASSGGSGGFSAPKMQGRVLKRYTMDWS